MAENEFEEDEKTEQPQDEQLKEIEEAERLQDKKDNRIAWLRFALIHIAVLIPLATGLGCLIGGTNSDNNTLAFTGKIVLEAGVPSVMAILVAALLIWKFRRRKPKTDTADENGNEANGETPSQREREQEMINAVNSTYQMASRANMAEYEVESVQEGMKHAPRWGIALGLTFFFSLLALLIAATVLLIKHIFVGAIVCAAIVGVVLISTFIITAVSRARAMNGDIRKAKKITEGTVKACFMIGTATTRTGGMRHSPNTGTVRIHSVTYRVIVTADGEEYGAYSKNFYETGEKVTVAVMGKSRAKIVEAEPEKTETE
ncbi:MAG: hypothetical protein K2N22_05900 [Clostridia bacterium]|nr:hypothetical protein [Clostridia bacterium]